MRQAVVGQAGMLRAGQLASAADLEVRWKLYLAGLRDYLERRIMGQSAALGRIARAVQSSELGFNERSGRPKGTFLLLGPTGVGKTESAKGFTEYVFGAHSALEMIFMNEYSAESRLEEFWKEQKQQCAGERMAQQSCLTRSKKRILTSLMSCSRYWRKGNSLPGLERLCLLRDSILY